MDRNPKTILLIVLFFSLIGLFKAEITLSQCRINITSISFGGYDVLSPRPQDTAGTITVDCDEKVPKVTITLGASATSGTFISRKLRQSGGNDLLNYNIFTDAARTTVFGNESGGTTRIDLQRPPGKPAPWRQNVTVYGRIQPGEDVSAGSYSDMLTATVEW